VPVRWVVDAMNVIGSRPDRWWNDPDKAMRRLAESLETFARATGDEVTVVFDRAPDPLPETNLVTIVTASRRGRNAADHEIVDLIAADDDARSLRVVTSDRELAQRVADLGAAVTPSGRFRRELDELSNAPG
jgi:uncharacterized protein YaiI (UPF0178 family)